MSGGIATGRRGRTGKADLVIDRFVFQIATSEESLASGHFVEWTAPAISYPDDFYCAADAQSQEDHDSADILMSAWGDDDSPFNYCTMIRFERLTIRSARH
jgi:hypothetical protein